MEEKGVGGLVVEGVNVLEVVVVRGFLEVVVVVVVIIVGVDEVFFFFNVGLVV